MTLLGILKSENDQPDDDGPPRPSMALIAARDGVGCLLDYTGSAIEWHVAEAGAGLNDLGLDDAPDGLSIWEGTMGSVKCVDTSDSYGEWDYEVIGDFRPATLEEAATYLREGCLWPLPEGPPDEHPADQE